MIIEVSDQKWRELMDILSQAATSTDGYHIGEMMVYLHDHSSSDGTLVINEAQRLCLLQLMSMYKHQHVGYSLQLDQWDILFNLISGSSPTPAPLATRVRRIRGRS